MSETQTFRGKFSCTDLTVEEFVDNNIKYLPEYYDQASLNEKFHEIVWEMCHSKNSKFNDFFQHNNIVYEVTELEDLQYNSFIEIDKVSGKFVTSFHDGGTDLSEMLSKGMED